MTLGRPRKEIEHPDLLKTISDIAIYNSAADERRQTEEIRTCSTLDELTAKLREKGFNLSRSAVYLRLLPIRSNTLEGMRHINTVPVRLCNHPASYKGCKQLLQKLYPALRIGPADSRRTNRRRRDTRGRQGPWIQLGFTAIGKDLSFVTLPLPPPVQQVSYVAGPHGLIFQPFSVQQQRLTQAEYRFDGQQQRQLRRPGHVQEEQQQQHWQQQHQQEEARVEVCPLSPAGPSSLSGNAAAPARIRGENFGGLEPVRFVPGLDPPCGACFDCHEPGHTRRQCSNPFNGVLCTNCGRRANFDAKMAKTKKNQNQCPICFKSLSTLSNFRKHLKAVHQKLTKRCENCKLRYLYTSMAKHIKTCTGCMCSRCGRILSATRYLKQHEQTCRAQRMPNAEAAPAAAAGAEAAAEAEGAPAAAAHAPAAAEAEGAPAATAHAPAAVDNGVDGDVDAARVDVDAEVAYEQARKGLITIVESEEIDIIAKSKTRAEHLKKVSDINLWRGAMEQAIVIATNRGKERLSRALANIYFDSGVDCDRPGFAEIYAVLITEKNVKTRNPTQLITLTLEMLKNCTNDASRAAMLRAALPFLESMHDEQEKYKWYILQIEPAEGREIRRAILTSLQNKQEKFNIFRKKLCSLRRPWIRSIAADKTQEFNSEYQTFGAKYLSMVNSVITELKEMIGMKKKAIRKKARQIGRVPERSKGVKRKIDVIKLHLPDIDVSQPTTKIKHVTMMKKKYEEGTVFFFDLLDEEPRFAMIKILRVPPLIAHRGPTAAEQREKSHRTPTQHQRPHDVTHVMQFQQSAHDVDTEMESHPKFYRFLQFRRKCRKKPFNFDAWWYPNSEKPVPYELLLEYVVESELNRTYSRYHRNWFGQASPVGDDTNISVQRPLTERALQAGKNDENRKEASTTEEVATYPMSSYILFTIKVYNSRFVKMNSILWQSITHIHTSKFYRYWDDPNELCERLKLLISEKNAGNGAHDNEIHSIIEELREEGVAISFVNLLPSGDLYSGEKAHAGLYERLCTPNGETKF
ncbi:unnamed protein product [Trichogramma brassicae]|uniref:CCHC-type domain-containing protein n=1 Tax=Trichogramma brassicae TaxID=86971 RepID=A0A6H5HWS2_9HYME|nr:unnamed protein product [Trichogramma brassicae]